MDSGLPTDLTPAESLCLLDPDGASALEMVKLTLISLVMRGVLRLEVRTERKGLVLKRDVVTRYLGAGERAAEPGLKPHETALVECFTPGANQVGAEVELKALAQTLARRYPRFSAFKKDLVGAPLLRDGFLQDVRKKVLFVFSRHAFDVTEKGRVVQGHLKQLVEDGETRLETWVRDEPERARAFLEICGTHVLLLRHAHDLSTIANWGKSLKALDATRARDDDGVFAYGWLAMHHYDHMTDDALGMDLDLFEDDDIFQGFDDFDSGFDAGDMDGGDCGDGGE